MIGNSRGYRFQPLLQCCAPTIIAAPLITEVLRTHQFSVRVLYDLPLRWYKKPKNKTPFSPQSTDHFMIIVNAIHRAKKKEKKIFH